MNYFASTATGNHSGPFSLVHSDSHHADTVLVPDIELLFSGEFHRAGLDLVITAHDGRHYVVADYFATEHPPTLFAPNGAHLSPDLVDLLVGSLAPNEYAQVQAPMQSAAPADSIGKVQKITGAVSVLRNGVSVALNVGDVVYKSDVLVTGSDSKVGLTFPDGTALELLANTRMALNEYTYSSSSTSNQALFTLVEGTFGFVAGKVAHTGDMRIGTPVATMGIRGTTGVVEAVANGTYSFSVYDDPGTTISGSWDMFVMNPDGSSTLIGTVSQTGYVTFVTPQGVGLPPLVTTMPLSASQLAADQLILQDLFDAFTMGGPHSTGSPGSRDNPLLQVPPNFFPEMNGNLIPITYSTNVLAPDPGLPPIQDPSIEPPPIKNPPAQPPQPPPPASNIFIWPAGNGTWPTGPDWNQGSAPNAANDIVILQSGMIQYDLNLTISSLTIDAPAELEMIGGGLSVTSDLEVAGILVVGGGPIFESVGTVTIDAGAEIISAALSFVDFTANTLLNFGFVRSTNDGIINFTGETIINEAGNSDLAPGASGGNITAVDHGFIRFEQSGVINLAGAVIEAGPDGGVEFADAILLNEAGASLVATGSGLILFDGEAGSVTNLGTIDANDNGLVVFYGINGIVNEDGAKIEATDQGIILFEDVSVTNYDPSTGQDSQVDNAGGMIAAFGQGAVVDLVDSTFVGGTFATSDLGDGNNGIITIVGGTDTVVFDGSSEAVRVDGFVQVDSGATLELLGTIYNQGTIDVDGAAMTNLAIAGTFSLYGSGMVTLEGSTDQIAGVDGTHAQLENFSTIDGAGSIGRGNEALTLVNEAGGYIDADMTGKILTIDTGNAITNMGTLEASHGGILQIDDPVNNSGGSALIQGGILEFVATTNVNQITFDNGSGSSAYGELIYESLSGGYTATINGFAGVGGCIGHSDAIDLAHIQECAISYSVHGDDTVITIAEAHGADAVLTLAGFAGDLNCSSDGHGGTLITDPPAPESSLLASDSVVDSHASPNGAAGVITFAGTDSSQKSTATFTPDSSNYVGQFNLGAVTENNGTASLEFNFNDTQMHLAPGQTVTQSYDVTLAGTQNPTTAQSQSVSVTVGGPDNDHFVFAPGIGADTLLNFNPQHDTIELDHFANVQTVQQLQSLVTVNAHDEPVIDLGNHDSVTLANTTQTQLQQAIQAGHLILH